jgi:hypothetical protein
MYSFLTVILTSSISDWTTDAAHDRSLLPGRQLVESNHYDQKGHDREYADRDN